jgi:hypothetical protein
MEERRQKKEERREKGCWNRVGGDGNGGSGLADCRILEDVFNGPIAYPTHELGVLWTTGAFQVWQAA